MEDAQTIFGLIRKEINDFTQNQIEVVPGCYFNQYDTIKRIHLYLNKKFQNNIPYHGRERIFYDVGSFRRDTVAKSIDIDVKDIKLVADNPESDAQTFIANKELKWWMKTNYFGEILNELGDDLASYGTVVLKALDTQVENVDLRRLFLDPTVKDIQNSRFITHELFLTEDELEAKRGKWDNIDELIEKFGSHFAPSSYENDGTVNVITSSPYFKIYERYGLLPEYMLDDTSRSKRLVRAMVVVAEPQAVSKRTDGGYTDEGLILARVKWGKKAYPFEATHYKRVKGRFLGVGVIEDLFEVQERTNEMANQKRLSMETSSIHLFQTTDPSAAINLAKYAENADVLVAKTPITPIATEERNLSAFGSEESLYNQLADRLTFAYDASRGEAMPSSTPATNAMIQQNNINSFFAKKRENFGLFITRVMNNHVLPQLLKDISEEHILRFIGDPEDMAKIDSLISPYYTKKAVIEEILSGKEVYADRLEEIKQSVLSELKKRGSKRFLDIRKDFYKNSKFTFDIVVTDEQRDTTVLSQNLFKLISDLSANPNIIEDPMMKVFYYKYADMIGINPMELELAMQKRQEMKATQPQMQQPMPQEAVQPEQEVPAQGAMTALQNKIA